MQSSPQLDLLQLWRRNLYLARTSLETPRTLRCQILRAKFVLSSVSSCFQKKKIVFGGLTGRFQPLFDQLIFSVAAHGLSLSYSKLCRDGGKFEPKIG